MDKMTFCENCACDREYAVITETVTFEIKGTKFSCPQKQAKCAVCGEQVYVGRLFDENNATGHDAYRAAMGVITVAQTEELLEKYDIGAVPLSRMLGWGDSTIYKQISGAIPSRERSDELKTLFAPEEMHRLLDTRGDVLTKVARRKVEKALSALVPEPYGCEKLVIPNYLADLVHKEAQKAGMPPQEYLVFVLGKGIGLSRKTPAWEPWQALDVEEMVRPLKQRHAIWGTPEHGDQSDGKREWSQFLSMYNK